MAPVAPLLFSLLERDIQAIVEAYTDELGNPKYKFMMSILLYCFFYFVYVARSYCSCALSRLFMLALQFYIKSVFMISIGCEKMLIHEISISISLKCIVHTAYLSLKDNPGLPSQLDSQ
ncbi:hypothetical protein RND81_02G167000 [Saponaria officinalis]|uniref:Uncharacterized protein n=1 Tax=Saponaria officinalis TaxID=3572 RepID=A0AAW1MM36_SAPOF